jgi:hypothetical protein
MMQRFRILERSLDFRGGSHHAASAGPFPVRQAGRIAAITAPSPAALTKGANYALLPATSVERQVFPSHLQNRGKESAR